MELRVQGAARLQGRIQIPGDKSIAHRALLLGALGKGRTIIQGFPANADCLATLDCLQALGVRIEWTAPEVVSVDGRGRLQEPVQVLDAKNSGTTMRLLLGLLAGQPFNATITGDASLCRRPMNRVTVPLREMGARISGREGGRYAPLTITGGNLQGISYRLPVASAQVKSALLLAGLQAAGTTSLEEPAPSRDHTERMLAYLGVDLVKEGNIIRIKDPQVLAGGRIVVPGDISSAAFLLVAGLLVPEGHVVIEGVGVNPTRTGILDLLAEAGGRIQVKNHRVFNGEPVADLLVEPARLKSFQISGPLVPRLIDEIPVLAVAATQAAGTTIIRDAGELRVKESDRLQAIVQGLRKLGGAVEERADGLIIHGPTALEGTLLESHGDHRMAMAWAVAGLLARGETVVKGAECIGVSFTGFVHCLAGLGAVVGY